MAGESFNVTDAQDMSIAQPVEAQAALSQEVCDVSASEQQDILKQESQRVSDTTKTALPELTISDEQSIDTASATTTAEDTQAQACAKAANTEVSAKNVAALFDKNFSSLDKDSDGFVSKNEVNKAVSDPCVAGSDAQLAYLLRNGQDQLQKLGDDEWGPENDGVTRADMAKLNELANKPFDSLSTDEQSVVAFANGSLATARADIDGSNRDLFADKTNPLNSIKPDAVVQGQIGDCYFLSALASTAQQNPEQIKNMIEDNKDGSYTVTFPRLPDDPVTVDAPTDTELAQFAQGGKYGTWPAVTEKAFGALMDPTQTVPQDGAPDGGQLRLGHATMSDKSIDTDILSFTSLDETKQKLTDAMRDHRAVTAGTSPQIFGGTDGVPDRHAYSVLDYDPKTEMVTIRNPWGETEPRDANGQIADGRNDGIFKMTVEEFDKTFSKVSYVEQ